MSEEEKIEESPEDGKTESPEENLNENISAPETIEQTETQIETLDIITSDIQNMEVHHHPHVEKKNFKEYLLEGLMIFLAVTMGFIAENIRESITENKIAGELAESLYKEVYHDSVSIHDDIEKRLTVKEQEVDHFIDYVKDSSVTNVSNDFVKNFFSGFLNNYFFEPKDGILSQLRNSGSLRYFKSSQLQEEIGQLSVAIANVRTRNSLEHDIILSTIKPFMLQYYDFSGFEAMIQHQGELTKEEEQFEEKRDLIKPRLLNADKFNGEEAINVASYYLMFIRGTRRFYYKEYADINHQLLETLRKKYKVRNE